MATNDFLPFATVGSPNVISQADYLAAAFRTAGFAAGVAESDQLNKVWRQSSVMSAVLAQFISDQAGVDVLDNADLATIIANLKLAISAAPAGSARLTLNAAAATGWFLANDGSIGDGTSGGTTRANADCAASFAVMWNSISNSFCQVQDSTGTPVSRGVSAAADFSAHRRILVPKVLGRALIIAGAGSGLTSRALGDGTIGAEANAILQANLPNLTLATAIASGQGSHTHLQQADTLVQENGGTANGNTNTNGKVGGTTQAATLPSMTATTPTGGSGTALSVMQPSVAWNVEIKL